MAGFSQLDETVATYTFQTFNDGDAASTWKALGAIFDGSPRYDTFQAVNTDSIPHNFWVSHSVDGTQLMAIIQLPARAGCDGAVAFDVLAVLKPSQFHYVAFNPFTGNADIQLMLVEVIGAGQWCTFTVEGGLT